MASGGRRDGAGRKPSPVKKKEFTTTLSDEARATLYSLRERTGVSISELIERMAAAMDAKLKSLGK